MSYGLESLDTHQPLFQHRGAPDVAQDVSFNLTLTASQHRSRAQVPLPYSHDGEEICAGILYFITKIRASYTGTGTANKTSAPDSSAVILYDPDSADDIDDDDPDEDLDI